MSETTTETVLAVDGSESAVAPAERVFYRADYARFATLLRRTRHVKGDENTPKPAELQAVIDTLAATLADAFAADSEAHPIAGVAPFNADIFMNGTYLG